MKNILLILFLLTACQKEETVTTGCVTAIEVQSGKRVLLYCGDWNSTADFYYRQPAEHSNIWTSPQWDAHISCQTCNQKYGN